MNKIAKVILGGAIPVLLIWIFFFYNVKKYPNVPYGMAILPMIFLSILLFIIGGLISFAIVFRKKKNKKNRKV